MIPVSKRATKGPGSRLYFGVLGLGLLSCVLILGLVLWQSLLDREERIEQEKESLARMAELVANDTADMFIRVRFFFETADIWLKENPGADPRFDPAFVKLVDAFRTSMKGRVDIRLVSETGGLFSIPSKSARPAIDVSDRDYYKAQASSSTRGFHIADPVLSRVTGNWGIPISYPLAKRNGGMSVIFAAIELPILEELYDRIRPKPNGSITLVRGDGIILARSPFREALIGKPIITTDLPAWRARIKATPKWVETRRAQTDNENRIIASRTLADPDLVVSISSRLGDVLEPWVASLWWRILIAALMIVAVGVISSKMLAALKSLDLTQAELRSNMERLARSDATKDKVFSVIAHDLRGPIGGMTSLLETLSTDMSDMSAEEVHEFINALRNASQNTSQLLENLLAWSRSQRGELPFRPERVLAYPTIEECVGIFGLNAAEKGLAIETSVENGLEAHADPEQLKILLRNLLSNAVKFSERGGRIRILAEKAEGGTRIEVRDEGIGMDRAQIEALFDFGSTRSRPGTANEHGSGLGLMLCKEIVDLHDGRIEVESAIGKGSAFSAFLPD
jgi:signal transduction histidine kinase